LKNYLVTDSKNISELCEKLQNLAVNMSISSQKLGKEGGTLSVVASHFQQVTSQLLSNYQTFSDNASKVSFQLTSIVADLLCSRVLIEMLGFYTYETHEKSFSIPKNQKEKLAAAVTEVDQIFKSAKILYSKSAHDRNGFLNILQKFKKDTESLQRLTMRLELISTGGKLEGSRTLEIHETFKPFIKEITKQLIELNQLITHLVNLLDEFYSDFEKITSVTLPVGFLLEECQVLLNSVKSIVKIREEIESNTEQSFAI
jgi:hypothetical protein